MIIRKQIEGFEDYSVDSTGNVYSMKSGEVIKRSQFNRGGYKQVGLYKNGKQTPKLVHQLVALAFLPNPNNKPQINHIDNNPSNNHISNLEWCTTQENSDHKVNQNRQHKPKGSKHGRSVLTELEIPLIRKLLEDGVTQKEIGNRFNVSHQTISCIKNNKKWTHC